LGIYKERKCTQLEEVAHDRDSWKKVVEQANNLIQVVALYKKEEK
jgi:hypothetical protein